MKGKNRTAIKKQQQSYRHLFLYSLFLFLTRSSMFVQACICPCVEQNNIYIYEQSLCFFIRSFVRSLPLSLSLSLSFSRPLLPLFLQCQCSLTVHTLLRLDARVIEHTLIHIYNNDGHHSSVIMFFFSSFSRSSLFFVESHRTI